MSSPFDIEAVQARRREIATEIERLTQEDRELEIAVRVAQRFSTGGRVTPAENAPSRLGPPRPADSPSLFEMVDTSLKDAVRAGKRGLKAQELVAEIGKRFWPGVQPQQVMPPIYGFAKNGRINKTKDGYFQPVQK